MAEGHLAVGQVGQHHRKRGSELTPAPQPDLLRGVGRTGRGCSGRGDVRCRIKNLLASAECDLAGAGTDRVKADPDREFAGVENLGAVVEPCGHARDEEVGQASPGFDRISARGRQHFFLVCVVRGCDGELLHRGQIEEGGLIGQKLERQGRAGLHGNRAAKCSRVLWLKRSESSSALNCRARSSSDRCWAIAVEIDSANWTTVTRLAAHPGNAIQPAIARTSSFRIVLNTPARDRLSQRRACPLKSLRQPAKSISAWRVF